jgi:GT2 family glycosyltransferase
MNSYNRLSLLKDALETLIVGLRAVPIPASIVILDAGSNDGSIAHLEKVISQTEDLPIHLINAPPRTSFSAGCNLAVDQAIRMYPELDYYFFYETDNFIHNPQALTDAIFLLAEKEELGAVGFTVENHLGKRTGHGERFPTFFSFLVGSVLYAKIAPNANQIKHWKEYKGLSWTNFDIVYTSPLLVKTAAWEAVGGMDSNTFPFSDSDLDLGWKLHHKGYLSAVLKAPGVWHDNLNQSSAWSSKRTIDLHRARYNLLLKHRGKIVVLLKPLLFLRHLAEFLMLSIARVKSKRIAESKKTRIHLMKSVFKGYSI